jgi:hypothetical protein
VNKKLARYETKEEMVTTQFISRTQHLHVGKKNLVVMIGGRNSYKEIFSAPRFKSNLRCVL